MTQSSEISYRSLAGQLDKAGLNLCALFSLTDLADSMPDMAFLPEPGSAQQVSAQPVFSQRGSTQSGLTQSDETHTVPDRYRNILLIGNAGRKIWQAMPREYLQRDNPVDEYTVDRVNDIFDQYLPAGSWQFLFPQSPPGVQISLQALGSLAGWHHASPLGIGINEQYGLWFAYRAVLVIESDLVGYDQHEKLRGESPCLSCDAAPCLSRCPAQALTRDSNPDLSACVTHRVLPKSDCASTCLARMACPIAPQYKYSDDQVAYFYDRSLVSVRQWVAARQTGQSS